MKHFDLTTLPWTDRPDFLPELVARIADDRIAGSEAESLRDWERDGFLRLRGLLPEDLCDSLLADYERAWVDPPDVSVLSEGVGVAPIGDLDRVSLEHHHYRLLDFQDVSTAATRVMMHPEIIRLLELVFDAQPVLMQTLFFEYGSEQSLHQDFAYVQADILSHLVGCWIALEDVDDENGPLVYLPGSHQIQKFSWSSGGMVFDGQDELETLSFERHIEAEAERMGLKKLILHAKKGDVLLWHCALAHGGSKVLDRNRSRKSIVGHFSTREGYPRDRRFPGRDPKRREAGGGLLYDRPGNYRRLEP